MSFNTTGKTYETKGTSVPTITFGGLSAGIAYTTQTCEWSIFGDRIFFDLAIILSSKGTSTGALSIATNLPTKYACQSSAALSVWVSPLTAGSGATAVFARSLTGGRSIQIGAISGVSGGFADWTDVDITNTTTIRVSGSWRIL